MARTVLSVNVNKIAVLRNARGGALPDPVRAARVAIEAGAGGITVHPRPDQRHIRADDVHALGALTAAHGVAFNIEGTPFAPPRAGYPGLLALVEATRPAQVTLVPDSDGQITSDHGFDLAADAQRLAPLVAAFRRTGARVSLFIDAGTTDFSGAAACGAERVELYTGPFAHAHAQGAMHPALLACRRSALAAQAAGLGVNAGHDLSQRNLGDFLRAVPGVLEVSIGHALIDDAVFDGLAATVAAYTRLIRHCTPAD